jgi:hypothetical protein
MRRQSETLLLLPLLPIFFLGAFPMLLMFFLGFAGLILLGILMICVGLAEEVHASSHFNQQAIVGGYSPRSERAFYSSNLRSAVRFAMLMSVAGVGLVLTGSFGLFYFGL